MKDFFVSICLLITFSTQGWVDTAPGIAAYLRGDREAAFEEFLPLAEAGSALAQTWLGFLLYKGAGIPQDVVRSHEWFHKAAAQADIAALYNLGILHATAPQGIALDYAEANLSFALAELYDRHNGNTNKGALRLKVKEPLIDKGFNPKNSGMTIFSKFCSGCHGFEGIAAYPRAPSFALGNNLSKDDPTLLHSVLSGKGPMPSWQDKLPVDNIRKAIGFLRSLPLRLKYGLPIPKPTDGIFFRFQPRGERGIYWWFESDMRSEQGTTSPSYAYRQTRELSDPNESHMACPEDIEKLKQYISRILDRKALDCR